MYIVLLKKKIVLFIVGCPQFIEIKMIILFLTFGLYAHRLTHMTHSHTLTHELISTQTDTHADTCIHVHAHTDTHDRPRTFSAQRVFQRRPPCVLSQHHGRKDLGCRDPRGLSFSFSAHPEGPLSTSAHCPTLTRVPTCFQNLLRPHLHNATHTVPQPR